MEELVVVLDRPRCFSPLVLGLELGRVFNVLVFVFRSFPLFKIKSAHIDASHAIVAGTQTGQLQGEIRPGPAVTIN